VTNGVSTFAQRDPYTRQPPPITGRLAARTQLPGGGRSPDRYSQVNLVEIEDAALANGFSDRWQARVARTALGARQTGVIHFRLLAGKRSPFGRWTQFECNPKPSERLKPAATAWGSWRSGRTVLVMVSRLTMPGSN
jgi:hypothetical protein